MVFNFSFKKVLFKREKEYGMVINMVFNFSYLNCILTYQHYGILEGIFFF